MLAVGVIDTRGAIGTTICPVGVRYGIRIIRVGAQSAEILAICGNDFWSLRGVGICDAGGRVGAAVGTVRSLNALAGVAAAKGAELVGCGIGEEWIRAELPEIVAIVITYLREGAWTVAQQSKHCCGNEGFSFHRDSSVERISGVERRPFRTSPVVRITD
jgi:hypothetical protein